MPHDSFRDAPQISWAAWDTAVRRAHQMRSRSVQRFFRKALDQRYRALHLDG